jgi:lysylphosphatidylglycerol synthetase-like protein (DUF2156 family)
LLFFFFGEPYIALDLPLPPFKSPFLEYPIVRVYLDTAIVVVISYATLLVIDVRFIVLAVFPFIATLGALVLMLTRLRLHDGVGSLLRKASLVALLVTVHAMADELLGENVVLLCVLELVPALLWSSLHLDRSSTVITMDTIKSNRNGLVSLGAGAVAGFSYLAASLECPGVR